jgi:hypothetical protein
VVNVIGKKTERILEKYETGCPTKLRFKNIGLFIRG